MSPITVREDAAKHTWISYEEASRISGLSRGTLYGIAHKGMIRVCRHGAFRVNHQSLLDYIGRR